MTQIFKTKQKTLIVQRLAHQILLVITHKLDHWLEISGPLLASNRCNKKLTQQQQK